MTFDDFSKFHDFPWLFQKILFFQVFQVFQTLWEPCKLISSVQVIYQKYVIFIFQIWIFDEMRDNHNVSKIVLIFFAQSKSACGGLVRQVRHFVQPWRHPTSMS